MAADLDLVQLGSYQNVPTDHQRNAGGFLLYNGMHHDRRVIVLASDIGSAVPSQDMRIYVQTGDFYRLVLSIPTAEHRGFHCMAAGDMLKVSWTKSYKKTGSSSEAPQFFMTIDIGELLAIVPASNNPPQPPARKMAD